MASKDHTARVPHLVCNEPKSKSTSSNDGKPPTRGSDEESRQAQVAQVADIAVAVAVLEGMRDSHRAFVKRGACGAKSGLLPLNPVQLAGLTTALNFLHHYVNALAPEQGG
ncbi:hypothetical protein [Dyella mobilis]|uniref:Uncharacterized protein n=1 Tax=Dyella mobilis TaxID=1849582 RepID=A0ABS2KFG7_9GAMM|nr:hypothetical protein [Dyella mobilis]MBM7129625.1 hypothetical protein [Dyella mobilis]GLQ98109.1 hypothetical protein GCM10007863_25290 [Dyella mobilis]